MKQILKNKIATIEELREFLKEFFRGKEAEVYLFGSRARGDASPSSDIDLAIVSDQDLSEDLTMLREILEESLLPYKVDLVDLKHARYLQKRVEKEGRKWVTKN